MKKGGIPSDELSMAPKEFRPNFRGPADRAEDFSVGEALIGDPLTALFSNPMTLLALYTHEITTSCTYHLA